MPITIGSVPYCPPCSPPTVEPSAPPLIPPSYSEDAQPYPGKYEKDETELLLASKEVPL